MDDAKKKGKVVPFRLKPVQPTEKEEQVALVKWLELAKVPFYAIPNGEKRDIITATNLKRQGVKAGVPDICVPLVTPWHSGLYIELKRRDGGVVSESQRKWVDLLNKNGYLALFCCGWEDAKDKVEKYLDGRI